MNMQASKIYIIALLMVLGYVFSVQAGNYPFTHDQMYSDIMSFRNGNGAFDASQMTYNDYCVHGLRLLQRVPNYQEDLIVWIQSCQNPDGGFGEYPGATSDMTSTYFAIHSLKVLGASVLDPEAARNFIDSCQVMEGDWSWPAGGYAYTPGEGKGYSILEATMYAIWGLRFLGYQPQNLQALIDFINAHQVNDGGFGIMPLPLGSLFPSMAMSCYWGALCCEGLNMEPPDKQAFINFCRSLQLGDGGFEILKGDGNSYTMACYWVIHALNTVNSLPSNLMGAVNYIQGLEKQTGGIRFGKDYSSVDPMSTYMGIFALQLMTFNARYINAHINYFHGCQNQDNAFGPFSGGESAMPHSYYCSLGLSWLGETIFPPTSYINWVMSCEDSFGPFPAGFGYMPGGAGQVKYSHYAYFILDSFGQASQSASYGWVGGCRAPLDPDDPEGEMGGFTSDQDDDNPSLEDTYHGCMVYDIVNKNPGDIEGLTTYVLGCQTESGGFGWDMGKSLASMEHTFHGVMCLNFINAEAADPEGLLNFIMGCHNEDGGFSFRPGYGSSYLDTYYALRSLEVLGELTDDIVQGATNFVAYYWPNMGHGPMADFIGAYILSKGFTPEIPPATPIPSPTFTPYVTPTPTYTPTPAPSVTATGTTPPSPTPTVTPTANPSHTFTATPTPTHSGGGPNAPTIDPQPPCKKGTTNTLSWSDESASGAVEYLIESSIDNFVSIQDESGWITTTQYTFRDLVDGWTYQYRVKARDVNMDESPWSAVVAVKQDNTPPKVLLGGYWDTMLSGASGGKITMMAYVTDPDVDLVRVYYDGADTGLQLNDNGILGDAKAGDNLFTYSTILSGGLPRVSLLLQFVVSDCAGNIGQWPLFSISFDSSAYATGLGERELAELSFERMLGAMIETGRLPGEPGAKGAEPMIYLGGYWDSSVTFEAGGTLMLMVYVVDAQSDVAAVELYFAGQPTGIQLLDNGMGGDWAAGDNLYTFKANLTAGAPVGDYLLEVVARDANGNYSDLFPYLVIR